MSYKLLYVEDQKANTIKLELESRGFVVDVYEPKTFEDYIDYIHKNDYDAFVMDFRLTEGKGIVDAPTYAATQRTSGNNRIEKPIILITNECYLSDFKNDFTSHDLFDLVLSKVEFRKYYDKYSERIKELINSYKVINDANFDIKQILKIDDVDVLDYRFVEKLSRFQSTHDCYGYSRTIIKSFIRAIGPLVGPDVLAARLGVNKSCDAFNKLLELSEFNKCRYQGIMSKTYDRWWFYKIKQLWNEISSFPLRRLDAQERTDILNKKFNLDLEAAKPIDLSSSTNFWTICCHYKAPLDPMDGYCFNSKNNDEWLEPDYISLKALLEYPDLKDNLSPLEQNEVILLGKQVSKHEE